METKPKTGSGRRARNSFGKIDKQRSGRFRASYAGPNGRRESAPTTFATRKEANDWLMLQRGDMVTGRWLDPQRGRMSVEAFGRRYWASEVALRPSARKQQESYWARYIVPTLGQVELGRLTRDQVQTWVHDLSRHGGAKGQGLAPRSVNKAGMVLHKLMDEAVAQNRIPTNPATKIDYPKPADGTRIALSPEQVDQLAGAIDPRYRALVPFLCWTGLRIGEAFALSVSDVTLDGEPEVAVTKTVTDLGTLHWSAPKTRAGRRIVPLADNVVAELRTHIDALGLGPADPLFPASKGATSRLNGWRRRVWNPAVEAFGMPEFNVHQTRRTAITRWCAFGVPIQTARIWAGHADLRMILDVYAVAERSVERQLIANVNAAMRERAGANNNVVPIRQ